LVVELELRSQIGDRTEAAPALRLETDECDNGVPEFDVVVTGDDLPPLGFGVTLLRDFPEGGLVIVE
jgi:hypothetical protein